MSSRSFEEQWPIWPDNIKGKQLISVVVSIDVVKLFRSLFSSRSSFVIQAHNFRGNSCYAETPWMWKEADIEPESSQLLDSSPQVWRLDAAGPCPTKGQFRRVAFSSVGMGMKYSTEEVQRVVEAKLGELYVVQGCVSTTATYGDVFRPITRFRLLAQGSKTELTIEYTLAFIAPVNRIIRTFIERGAEQGLTKNFAQLVEVLKQQVGVEDAESARLAAATAAQQGEPRQMGGLPHNAGPALQWAGLLGSELVTLMEAPAAMLRGWLPYGADDSREAEGLPSRWAQGLALLLMLLAAAWAVAALERLRTASHYSTRLGAATVAAVLDLVQVGRSLRALLSSFLLLALVRQALTHAAAIVPALLEALQRRGQHSTPARAAATGSSFQGPSSPSSEDGPSKGVRFEGYAEAIASATAGSAATWAGSAVVLQQTMSSLRGMLSPRSMAAPTPFAEAAPPAGAAVAECAVLTPRSVGSFLGLLRPRLEETSTDSKLEQEASRLAADEWRSRLPHPEQEPSGPLLYEVFENERCQPFRGWGHTWPGHFLPTDWVGHWSMRDGSPGGKLSMSFHYVAPKLPPGFTWLEEKWHVDLSGQSAAAVDADGWTYAVDFPWLSMPPTPGSGSMSVKDFTRRRRWIRTRVPAPCQALPHLRPATVPPGDASAGEPGLVGSQSPVRLHEALSYPRSGILCLRELCGLLLLLLLRDGSSGPLTRAQQDSVRQQLPSAQVTATAMGQAKVLAADPPGAQGGWAEEALGKGQPPQADASLSTMHAFASDSASRSLEAAEHLDGDSSRESAHPATVQPQRAPPRSSQSSQASVKLKLNIPSWLQNGELLAVASAGRAAAGGNLAGSTSAVSSEDSAAQEGAATFASVPRAQVSALGPASRRLTAEQAATAARLLMAGYDMNSSLEAAVSPRDSPKAMNHVVDSGHMLISSAIGSSRAHTSSPLTATGSDRSPSSDLEQSSPPPKLSCMPETSDDVLQSSPTAILAPDPSSGAATVEDFSIFEAVATIPAVLAEPVSPYQPVSPIQLESKSQLLEKL